MDTCSTELARSNYKGGVDVGGGKLTIVPPEQLSFIFRVLLLSSRSDDAQMTHRPLVYWRFHMESAR